MAELTAKLGGRVRGHCHGMFVAEVTVTKRFILELEKVWATCSG